MAFKSLTGFDLSLCYVDTIPFSSSGAQTVHTGVSRFPFIGAGTILSVVAMLNTAPTGATTFKIDVNKNGTSLWNTNQTNRPIWVASANAATVGALDTTTIANGDYLTVDIDAVGSTIAGSDLVVVVRILRTS